MSFYRVVPLAGPPCVRQAGTVAAATARALREHPAGLQSVELLNPAELVKLAAEGWPLPAAARALAGAHAAAQRSKQREAARKAAARNAATEAKEQLLAQARAEKEERRALLQAERRREKARVQREARKAAEVPAPSSPMLGPLPLPVSLADHTSAPW